MPTAGRLAGAVIFGLFGWYIATLAVPFFPESRPPDFWFPSALLISIFIGWRICGTRAGRGYNAATGIGLTAGAAIAFCLVFALAFEQMIKNSMRLRYSGPTEAIIDTFNLMAEYAVQFYSVSLIVTVIVGGMICAWMTEFVGQRFP
ncbi:TrgA family protein [Yoonia litorea]|uniref:Tellurite resistance protein n=1 Tax=Yoonia litorea TaxID=1123755 RepID=A0A1I6M6Y6_9RHOB|nr:TrgA family protein [Yoonia litorea]SFS11490.1 hypothetical protein SAMN05444714_1322 [Yoonia litorea]